MTQKKATLGLPSNIFGAKDEVRTRDLDLGKVALYQLSYFRLVFPNLVDVYVKTPFSRFGIAKVI